MKIAVLLLYAVAVLCAVFLFAPTNSMACETTLLEISGGLNSAAPLGIIDGRDATPPEITLSADIFDSFANRHTIYIAFWRLAEHKWHFRGYVDPGETISGARVLVDEDINFASDGTLPTSGERELRASYSWATWINGAPPPHLSLVFSLRELAAATSISVRQDGTSVACTQRGHLDFDGDGIDDPAIFRPQFGMWAILKSTTNMRDYIWKQWGLPGDYPMAGDFTGDGRSDLVVWRPTDGNWFVCSSDSGFDCTQGTVWQFGLPGDRPIRGDFDSDGIADFAVWRPPLGFLFYRGSRTGEASMLQWGLPGDIPLNTGSN